MVKVVVVGGVSSGVGKSVISIALMGALRRRGLKVQGFKVGPDFLDTLHHEAATGRSSTNIDGWMLEEDSVRDLVARRGEDADIAIIEGSMGLFDGREGTSEDGSTAQIAKWLGAPVILVVDCWALARSAAAIIQGYQNFDLDLDVKAVIMNKVGGQAHTTWLKDAVKASGVEITVLGGIPSEKEMTLQNGRPMWPRPQPEGTSVPKYINTLAEAAEAHLDLDKLLALAVEPTPPTRASLDVPSSPGPARRPPRRPRGTRGCDSADDDDSEDDEPVPRGGGRVGGALLGLFGSLRRSIDGPPTIRVGVARDEAFCFYYNENLELLKESGAELVFFSPLRGSFPEQVHALYIGGGYLESHAAALAANRPLVESVRVFAEAGGVVYAECGGLMYLSQSIQTRDGRQHEMCGFFPFRTRITADVRIGYVEVMMQASCPLFPEGKSARGYVFRASDVVKESIVDSLFDEGGSEWEHGYACTLDGKGKPRPEGYTMKNVLASYVHLHWGSNPSLALNFVERCRSVPDSAAADAAAAGRDVATDGPLGGPESPPTHPGAGAAGRLGGGVVGGLPPDGGGWRGGDPLASEQTPPWKGGPGGPGRTAISIDGRSSGPPMSEGRMGGRLGSSNSLASYWGGSDSGGGGGHRRNLSGDVRSASFQEIHFSQRHHNGNGSGHGHGNVGRSVERFKLANSPFQAVRDGRAYTQVGVSDQCDWPLEVGTGRRIACRSRLDGCGTSAAADAAARDLVARGEPLVRIDGEWLRHAAPTLVITCEPAEVTGDTDRSVAAALSEAGLLSEALTTTIVIRPRTVGEVLESIMQLGFVAGADDAAAALVDSLRARLRKVAAEVASQERRRVLLLQGLSPIVAGGRWIPEMIALAGGQDGLLKAGDPSERLNWDQVVAERPEVLVLTPPAATLERGLSEVAALAALPGFWTLPAVQRGEVYFINHVYFTRPGPRLVDGVEMLSRVLSPGSASRRFPPGTCFKLELSNGQRCRPRHIADHFHPIS